MTHYQRARDQLVSSLTLRSELRPPASLIACTLSCTLMARGVLWIVLRLFPQLAMTLTGRLGVHSTRFMLGLARGAHMLIGDGCLRARHRMVVGCSCATR